MPFYEYRCSNCGHELEVLQKLSDKLLVDCPACGKQTLSKMVSAAGFQLKGSGWYVTDFRDGNKAGKDTAESGSKDGTAPADSTAAAKGDKSGESAGPDGKGKAGDVETKKTEPPRTDATKSAKSGGKSASSSE